MSSPSGPNAQRYLSSILDAIEADLGTSLPSGTTLVPTADRAGSGIATCYPFSGRSAVWCDPNVVQHLAPVAGSVALTAPDFIAACVALGAEVRGTGLNRVLDGAPLDPRIDLGPSTIIHSLDGENESDVALIAALLATVSDEEADEADFDIADLDPHLVAAVDTSDAGSGEQLLSLAGARLADSIPFDDIGVITRPDSRRRGLGLACVHRLVELRRASGVPAMYRCEQSNAGSNQIAERLGFELVQAIGSIRFRTPAQTA